MKIHLSTELTAKQIDAIKQKLDEEIMNNPNFSARVIDYVFDDFTSVDCEEDELLAQTTLNYIHSIIDDNR